MSSRMRHAIINKIGTEWQNDPAQRVSIERIGIGAARAKFFDNQDGSPECVDFILKKAREAERDIGPALHQIGRAQGYKGESRTLNSKSDNDYRFKKVQKEIEEKSKVGEPKQEGIVGKKFDNCQYDPTWNNESRARFYGSDPDNAAPRRYWQR